MFNRMMKAIFPFLAWFLAFNNLHAKPIYTTYIAPNNYRGPLTIVLKPSGGLILPPLEKGWVFRFPANGILEVNQASYQAVQLSGSSPENYLGPRARYEDGSAIPMDKAADTAVALRPLYGVASGVEKGPGGAGAVYFYLGTAKEAKAFEDESKRTRSGIGS